MAENDTQQRRFREALGRFATGIAVVTRNGIDGKPLGMTINSFASVSLTPQLVLWSVDKSSPQLAAYLAEGEFAISVLHEDQADLCWHFATSSEDKFASLDGGQSASGVPLLPRALSVFHCRLKSHYDEGDHHIIVGEVLDFQCEDGRPLVFSQGQLAVLAPLTQEVKE